MIESVPDTPDPEEYAAAGTGTSLSQRLAALEDKVAAMQRELDALKEAASTQASTDIVE
jgi:uncharacterized protein YceH (UPF0502 family)